MQHSLPQDLLHIDKYIVQAHPKAYRFVREMEEMSGFVHDCLGNGNGLEISVATSDAEPAHIFDGFAALYFRVAQSFKEQGIVRSDGKTDVDVLNGFVQRAANARLAGDVRN